RQASSGISSVAWCPHCGQVMIDCFEELLAPEESLAFIASTWDSVFIGQRAHAFCYRFLQNSELIFIQQVACDLTNRELFRSRFCEAFFQCAGECLLEPLPLRPRVAALARRAGISRLPQGVFLRDLTTPLPPPARAPARAGPAWTRCRSRFAAQQDTAGTP